MQGEICVRGYAVMKGYDGDPEGTADVVKPDGWLHTGDLGVMREDGCIHITGRSRDVIIRGGENIYPREVEEFLYTHPKVGEVQVVGIPNARLGEIVVAWIRLRPGIEATEEEIRDFCKGQIAYYKIPEHVRFVDEFPATSPAKSRSTKSANSKSKPAACSPSQKPQRHNCESSHAAVAIAAVRITVTTVMSSSCPNRFAVSTISAADFIETSRARSKPKSSPFGRCASITPSE